MEGLRLGVYRCKYMYMHVSIRTQVHVFTHGWVGMRGWSVGSQKWHVRVVSGFSIERYVSVDVVMGRECASVYAMLRRLLDSPWAFTKEVLREYDPSPNSPWPL